MTDPKQTPMQERALRTARFLVAEGHAMYEVINNPLIPADLKEWVERTLETEGNRTFQRARVISVGEEVKDWLSDVDRADWYYWPALRSYLLGIKGRSKDFITSLDDASDRVLAKLGSPSQENFDVRGLVLGYVQSGKTANFAAVIAKAADAGYRLIVVFSGVDNGLRRQTQIRLSKELTGYAHNSADAVPLPPIGKQWHKFTGDEFDGDFDPGRSSHAALQGSEPVLLVVKKNPSVLRKLQAWLQNAPLHARTHLPVLFVDDEADQASVDGRSSIQTEQTFDPSDPEYAPPAVINGLIRELLLIFEKRSYVGYTATPFANILIPHEQFDPKAGLDLYPKDFFIDLPKPDGYFGTEEFFGRFDAATDERVSGIPVLRPVEPSEIISLIEEGLLTASLDEAMCSFVLGGAARALRGSSSAACTMLVHMTHLNSKQGSLKSIIEGRWRELRDEWRYNRHSGIFETLQALWDRDFVPTTALVANCEAHSFEDISQHIGKFMEAVEVREINTQAGDVLDYEREPSLKAIAVGGNKLSRGLTLEGLLVSYFARRSPQYDTLLQMARWYGFRTGYQDLTRIYTTGELMGWFYDLALVEHRLREDLEVYENMPGITPKELGMRILRHPAMQVTASIKQRSTSINHTSVSYELQLEQTFRFPAKDLVRLRDMSDRNHELAVGLISHLGVESTTYPRPYTPQWSGVKAVEVVDFLRGFDFEPTAAGCRPDLMANWIEFQNLHGGLVHWSVVIRGRESSDATLGTAEWLPKELGTIHNISRSRIAHSDSLGVITTAGDEAFGLSPEELASAQALLVDRKVTKTLNRAARFSRDPASGLLILYPISRFSGHEDNSTAGTGKRREVLYDRPQSTDARDILGISVSFPKAAKAKLAQSFIEGTSAWRALE